VEGGAAVDLQSGWNTCTDLTVLFSLDKMRTNKRETCVGELRHRG